MITLVRFGGSSLAYWRGEKSSGRHGVSKVLGIGEVTGGEVNVVEHSEGNSSD